MIKKRVASGEYTAELEDLDTPMEPQYYPTRFMEDMTLLRDNCHLYCADRYPEVMAAASVVHALAADLCDAFFNKEGTLISQSNPLLQPPSSSSSSSSTAMPSTFTVR